MTAQTATGACTDNIDRRLPGHFADPLARAKAERRLLLINGVSFGIDSPGAKCGREQPTG